MVSFHVVLLADTDPVVIAQLLKVFVSLRGRNLWDIFSIKYLHIYDLIFVRSNLVFFFGAHFPIITLNIIFFFFGVNKDFLNFILISWRLITLQYCSGFCHKLK